jgi:hypothetical protein
MRRLQEKGTGRLKPLLVILRTMYRPGVAEQFTGKCGGYRRKGQEGSSPFWLSSERCIDPVWQNSSLENAEATGERDRKAQAPFGYPPNDV